MFDALLQSRAVRETSPPTPSPGAPPPLASGERSAAYRRVEGWHLRQVAVRSAPLLAVLATNGRGWLDVDALPAAVAPDAHLVVALAGAVLVLVSAWLRVLAKGVLVRKTTLTTGGAYRLVRHPFYLANLVGAVGVFALAGLLGLLYAAAWLVVALPVYVATVRGEEDGLATLYPARWERYAARVPGLLPRPGRLGPRPDEPVRVTFANLVAEREPPRLLRFLSGALLVGAFAVTGVTATALATAAGVAFVASHLVPRPPSRRATN